MWNEVIPSIVNKELGAVEMIDTRTAPYGAFMLRVGLGAMALAHGLLKVFVFTIPGTVGFFESLGYPGFFAYIVIVGEIAGGIGELGWEFGDVLEFSPAEAVDRLIRITGCGDVVVAVGQPLEQRGLGVRGVLVLVDEEVGVLGVEPIKDVGVEDGDRFGEQCAVVEHVAFA